MLVLTRKIGEEIIIDDVIIVKVLRSSGSRVRLGIDAPRGTNIHRMEVWAKTQAEAANDATGQ